MMETPLWYPYAQMRTMPDPLKVSHAEGVRLHLVDGRTLIDGIASWWCVIHGYNHPRITAAAKAQLDRMSHVMLGGLSHEPAEALAAELVRIAPVGLRHVFYSDSGSVGVEVALKMAVQYWFNQGLREKKHLIAFEHAYHGDTTGCMSVCDPEEGMHRLFGGFLLKQHILPAPSADIDGDMRWLDSFLKDHAADTAGLIIEPLLQAAGGFNMYPAEWLRQVRGICDKHGILLIFDEVATGFGRTGTRFAAEQAGISPDIMILGKGLTAGYCGHAATLANDRVFEAFLGDAPGREFMHGPTFMGNPLACAIALEGIRVFEEERYLEKIARIEAILREELLPLTADAIAGTRVLGACGVIEVRSAADHAGFQEFAAARGVWLRPFGRWIYTMPPYIISEADLRAVTGAMRAWFA